MFKSCQVRVALPPNHLANGRPMSVGLRCAIGLLALSAALPATGQDDADARDQADAMQAIQSSLTQAIDRAAASVVAIARVRKDQGFDVTSELQFNLPGMGKPLITPTDPRFVPTQFASGVIVSNQGDVLTTFHSLGDPKENDYYVWHSGVGKRATVTATPVTANTVTATPAQVQAGDPWTDLAVLRFAIDQSPAIAYAKRSDLQRGQLVVALGNPEAIARDGQPSASMGIIANLQRVAAPRPSDDTTLTSPDAQRLQDFGTLIQTDARLNLGTSGGALVNMQGELIGITTSLAAVAGFEQSAGFAIPIDASMQAVIEQLQNGKTPAFGFLGLEPSDLPIAHRRQGLNGAWVRQVLHGLPAENAGLRSGDVISQVDGMSIHGARDLFREVSRRPAGATVKLKLVAGNPITGKFATRWVDVRLGKKYLALAQPAYSLHREHSWRGLQVDHGTALPPGQMLGISRSGEPLPVAVVSVQPDTAAWKAGLRPGQFIVSVNDKPVVTPEAFYNLVGDKGSDQANPQGSDKGTNQGDNHRPITLVVRGYDKTSRTIVVPAE